MQTRPPIRLKGVQTSLGPRPRHCGVVVHSAAPFCVPRSTHTFEKGSQTHKLAHYPRLGVGLEQCLCDGLHNINIDRVAERLEGGSLRSWQMG